MDRRKIQIFWIRYYWTKLWWSNIFLFRFKRKIERWKTLFKIKRQQMWKKNFYKRKNFPKSSHSRRSRKLHRTTNIL